jgi:hypothetical protein
MILSLSAAGMKCRMRKVLWVGVAVIALIVLGVTFWRLQFHSYTPIEALRDLEAAAQVRNAPRPVERFLELRYGPLTEPANRRRAFLDFFNVGHIKGLNMLVSRMPSDRRQSNITAMAQWVANYRATMTSEEKAALGSYVTSPVGRATLQQATAQYLQQDVRYRAGTAPVIQELMTTLATVQRP